MNKVMLVGRLTGTPEMRNSGEKLMARFSVAVRESQDKTNFINCVAFGKRAEIIERYFYKGSRIGVAGTWLTSTYTDSNGNKRRSDCCMVSDIDFIDTKKESASLQNQMPGGVSVNSSPYVPPQNKPEKDDFVYIPEDIDADLPFA